MSQYPRSSRTERAPGRDSQYNTRNDSPSTGRAWTITSDEEPDFCAPSDAGPQSTHPSSAHSEDRRSRAPSHHGNSSRRSRHSNYDRFRGSNPPVRIRSPSPSSRRRNPADNAPTFLAWLQSRSGPQLTHEEAACVISTMTWDELLYNERKTALERSVAARSQAEYSESVYSSQAPPSLYGGGGQGPLSPHWRYEESEANDRTQSWVDDVRDSEASRSRHGHGNRRQM